VYTTDIIIISLNIIGLVLSPGLNQQSCETHPELPKWEIPSVHNMQLSNT